MKRFAYIPAGKAQSAEWLKCALISLSDEQYDLLKEVHAASGETLCSVKAVLAEKMPAGLIEVRDGVSYVPAWIDAVLKEISLADLEGLRRKVSWMYFCMKYFALVYGMGSTRLLVRLYNKLPGENAPRQLAGVLFDYVNNNTGMLHREEGMLFSGLHGTDEELYTYGQKARSMEISIPTYRELRDIQVHGYPLTEEPWNQLRETLKRIPDIDQTDMERALGELFVLSTSPKTTADAEAMLQEQGIHWPEEMQDEMTRALADVMMNARIAVFNGGRRRACERRWEEMLADQYEKLY
ncbi:MAG: hypothetical protein IKD69_13260 [Solobacterium sp.]|nr:hypothetical protein [Solobacterium sp.]